MLDLSKIDISQLMGGQPLNMNCDIILNRITVHLTLLLDTRANAFAIIYLRIVIPFLKIANRTIQPLRQPVAAKGYDGKLINQITYYTILILTLDRRRIRISFLILNISHYDIILGRK